MRQNGTVTTREVQKFTHLLMEHLSKIIDAGRGWILRTSSLNLKMWHALAKAGFRTTHFIAEPSALNGDNATISLESEPDTADIVSAETNDDPEAATDEQPEGNQEQARNKDVINHAKSLGLPISAVPETDLDESARRGLLKEFLHVFTPLPISRPQKPLAIANLKKSDDAKPEPNRDSCFGRSCPVTYYESGLLVEGKHHLSLLKCTIHLSSRIEIKSKHT